MDISEAERAVLDEIGSPPAADCLDRPEGFEGHELPPTPRPRVFRPRWIMEAVYGAELIEAMIARELLAAWSTWVPAKTEIRRYKDGRIEKIIRTMTMKPFVTLTALAAEILGVELADRGWRYRRPLSLKEPIRPANQCNAPLPLPLPNLVAAPKNREWYTDEIPKPKRLDKPERREAKNRGRKASA